MSMKVSLEPTHLLQELPTNFPLGFVVVQNTRFRLFNRQFQKYFGYTKDELLSIDGWNIIYPSDRESLKKNTTASLKGRPVPYELRCLRKDGTLRWVVTAITAGQYRGKPAILGYSLDIDQQKRTEEERVKDLANSLPQIIFEMDKEGNITFANSWALDKLGYTQDDLAVGINILQMLIPDGSGKGRERIRRLLSAEKLLPIEYTARMKNGRTFPILVYPSPIVKENRQVGVRVIGVDITYQKRLSENMQFYILQTIKAQEEERKRIARELHDDTTQALSSLLLDIEILRRVKNKSSGETLTLLDDLSAKVNNIISGVRRFSHELRPDVLDRLGLLPALELLSTELKEKKNINIYLETNGHCPRLSPETELVLFRIAQEALRNVEKHSQATIVIVKVTFQPGKISLQVTDNGVGFEVPKLMGDLARTGKLGLMGMLERAHLLGGKFSIQSEPGKGTSVQVELKV